MLYSCCFSKVPEISTIKGKRIPFINRGVDDLFYREYFSVKEKKSACARTFRNRFALFGRHFQNDVNQPDRPATDQENDRQQPVYVARAAAFAFGRSRVLTLWLRRSEPVEKVIHPDRLIRRIAASAIPARTLARFHQVSAVRAFVTVIGHSSHPVPASLFLLRPEFLFLRISHRIGPFLHSSSSAPRQEPDRSQIRRSER